MAVPNGMAPNLAPSLTTYSCEGGPYANYTQPSSKQAQLCPHVKGQQQESLREDNNNVSCVSFTDRDDKRYNSGSLKHHIAGRCSDRYIYHPGELGTTVQDRMARRPIITVSKRKM